MYNMAGKVALVTGTSRKKGLGRCIALRLAQEGADVVITDIHRKQDEPWEVQEGWRGMDSLVAEIQALGRKSMAIFADNRNSQEVDEAVKKTIAKFGKIDILVNNAALVSRDLGKELIIKQTDENFAWALEVNLTGTFHMARAVAREMVRRNQGGKIINIASMNGKKSTAGYAPYTSSKFGVIGLTQSLAEELAPYKINVNAVCPGFIVTWTGRGKAIYDEVKRGMSEEEAILKIYKEDGSTGQVPLGRPAFPKDIANVVAFLASDQADYMTGQSLNVTGGMMMVH